MLYQRTSTTGGIHHTFPKMSYLADLTWIEPKDVSQNSSSCDRYSRMIHDTGPTLSIVYKLGLESLRLNPICNSILRPGASMEYIPTHTSDAEVLRCPR